MSNQADDFFGEVISKYSAEDAVSDGVFVRVGTYGRLPVYFTSNLHGDFKSEPEGIRRTANRGLELLAKADAEDTDYMKLRVVEKGRIWVVLNGEGITFMRPEDY